MSERWYYCRTIGCLKDGTIYEGGHWYCHGCYETELRRLEAAREAAEERT